MSVDEIPVDIKKSILGTQEKILYVEGNDESLDKKIYSALLADSKISIVPVGNRDNVRKYVEVIKNYPDNIKKIYGLVDGDNMEDDKIKNLNDLGVDVLDLYSIESLCVLHQQ